MRGMALRKQSRNHLTMLELVLDALGSEDEGEDDQNLPTVVDDADHQIYDEDAEVLEDEADLERMLQAIKKSAVTKVKRRRQTLPARRDKNGDRIWKAIVLQYHEGPLENRTAAINPMVDKLRCARRFEMKLTFSVEKRIKRARTIMVGQGTVKQNFERDRQLSETL